MTLSFPPSNTLVQPIVHQLATILKAQIPGLGNVYEELPERPPEHLSVLLPLTRMKVESDTNGKLYLRLTFSIRLVLRAATLQGNVQTAYTYLPSFLSVLSAWANQSLTDSGGVDRAISVSPQDGGVTQVLQGTQKMVALVVNTDVLTEFAIYTGN